SSVRGPKDRLERCPGQPLIHDLALQVDLHDRLLTGPNKPLNEAGIGETFHGLRYASSSRPGRGSPTSKKSSGSAATTRLPAMSTTGTKAFVKGRSAVAPFREGAISSRSPPP